MMKFSDLILRRQSARRPRHRGRVLRGPLPEEASALQHREEDHRGDESKQDFLNDVRVTDSKIGDMINSHSY